MMSLPITTMGSPSSIGTPKRLNLAFNRPSVWFRISPPRSPRECGVLASRLVKQAFVDAAQLAPRAASSTRCPDTPGPEKGNTGMISPSVVRVSFSDTEMKSASMR